MKGIQELLEWRVKQAYVYGGLESQLILKKQFKDILVSDGSIYTSSSFTIPMELANEDMAKATLGLC